MALSHKTHTHRCTDTHAHTHTLPQELMQVILASEETHLSTLQAAALNRAEGSVSGNIDI